jgi:hypothetical protein
MASLYNGNLIVKSGSSRSHLGALRSRPTSSSQIASLHHLAVLKVTPPENFFSQGLQILQNVQHGIDVVDHVCHRPITGLRSVRMSALDHSKRWRMLYV